MFNKKAVSEYNKLNNEVEKTLTAKDLIFMGFGIIVCTSIFTLPGQIAAKYSGPSMIIALLIAAFIVILIALIYAEFSSALPLDGSAYSWVHILLGHFPAWIVGWLLVSSYILCVAFIASGFSSNLQPILKNFSLVLPVFLSKPLTSGGFIDVIAIVVILFVSFLLHKSTANLSKIDNVLVIIKIIAIIIFVIIGLQYINLDNFTPFIPEPIIKNGESFGGIEGIISSVSIIFIAYLGFDAITASSAEVKDAERNVPIGIVGSIVLATIFFILVSIVLIGVTPYQNYLTNNEPIGYVLRLLNYSIVADIIQTIAVVGMLTAIIGLMLSTSRLLFILAEDKMITTRFIKRNKVNQPVIAIRFITITSIVLSGFCSLEVLAGLISAASLIVFMIITLAMFLLRKREGKDINVPHFKVFCMPLVVAISFISCFILFTKLEFSALFYTMIWIVIGIGVYLMHNKKILHK